MSPLYLGDTLHAPESGGDRAARSAAVAQSIVGGPGIQAVSVLPAPGEGLTLRIEDRIGGGSEVVILDRQAAEALVEQIAAVLRRASTDPYAGAVASRDEWVAQHRNGTCPTCNDWEQRRAGRACLDCEGGTGPCACQLEERPYLRLEAPVTISKEDV